MTVKTFCWRVMYHLKVRNDVRECLDDWLHALRLDPSAKQIVAIDDGPKWCDNEKKNLLNRVHLTNELSPIEIIIEKAWVESV
jgi:hypothetical protein